MAEHHRYVKLRRFCTVYSTIKRINSQYPASPTPVEKINIWLVARAEWWSGQEYVQFRVGFKTSGCAAWFLESQNHNSPGSHGQLGAVVNQFHCQISGLRSGTEVALTQTPRALFPPDLLGSFWSTLLFSADWTQAQLWFRNSAGPKYDTEN
jgi:hypothetical protein